jgi:hypothetical protein
MVYSGDQLIYGVRIPINDACKYVLKYISKNNINLKTIDSYDLENLKNSEESDELDESEEDDETNNSDKISEEIDETNNSDKILEDSEEIDKTNNSDKIEELNEPTNLDDSDESTFSIYSEVSDNFEYPEISDDDYAIKSTTLIEIFEELNLSISIHTERCCLQRNERTIFLGVHLATNDIVFRIMRYKFNSIERYIDFYTKGIKNLTKKFYKKKNKYICDIKKIINNDDIPIIFYSIPNNCSSCT